MTITYVRAHNEEGPHFHSTLADDTCFFSRRDAEEFERDVREMDDIQRQELRAETFAAEAMLGMRAGTTEGWYDDPEEQREDW